MNFRKIKYGALIMTLLICANVKGQSFYSNTIILGDTTYCVTSHPIITIERASYTVDSLKSKFLLLNGLQFRTLGKSKEWQFHYPPLSIYPTYLESIDTSMRFSITKVTVGGKVYYIAATTTND